jgi:hypothetical protein
MRGPLLVVAVLVATTLLGGCGGPLQTPGEALRIFDQSLPQAFLGEPFAAPVRAVGGLRPFTFQLRDGALPSGLELVNGTIRGKPSETGRFEFTVVVSDANLSRTFQEYTLTVVERPPPRLSLDAPLTEIRGPTVVRLRVADASELRAASASLTWDPERLSLVADSVEGRVAGSALLWRNEPGSLQIDLAALGASWNGGLELASFTLTPSAPLVARVELVGVLLDDRGGRHYQGPAAGDQSRGEGAEDEAAEGEGADGAVDESNESQADEPADESDAGDSAGDSAEDEEEQ